MNGDLVKSDEDPKDEKVQYPSNEGGLAGAFGEIITEGEAVGTKEVRGPTSVFEIGRPQEDTEMKISYVLDPEQGRIKIFKDIAGNLGSIGSLLSEKFTTKKGETFSREAFVGASAGVLSELETRYREFVNFPQIQFLLEGVFARFDFIYKELIHTIRKLEDNIGNDEEFDRLANYLHHGLMRSINDVSTFCLNAHDDMSKGEPFESILTGLDLAMKLPAFPMDQYDGIVRVYDQNKHSGVHNYEQLFDGAYKKKEQKLVEVRLDKMVDIDEKRKPLIDELLLSAKGKLTKENIEVLEELGSFQSEDGMKVQRILGEANLFLKQGFLDLVSQIFEMDAKYMFWKNSTPKDLFKKLLQAKSFQLLNDRSISYQDMLERYDKLEEIRG